MRTLFVLVLLIGTKAYADSPPASFLNAEVKCEWCSKHTVAEYFNKGFGAGVNKSWEKIDDNTWVMIAEVVDPLAKTKSTMRFLFAKTLHGTAIGGVMLDGQRADPRTADGIQQGMAANIDK